MLIRDLTFLYGDFVVFKDFNFESNEPIIAFKGPSGCGKTTLLKLISKNLTPTQYRFIEYSASTYFVIQEDSLLPWLTGEENIFKFLKIERGQLESSKIYPFVQPFFLKKAFEMSYGQRRMIELFRAILFKPDLLLLDEPFNFLDNKGRKLFTTEILALIESGTKIILTSHYNEDISYLNPKIYYFNNTFPISNLDINETG